MKNVEQTSQAVDFQNVSKGLLSMAEKGGFKRRKTLADTLDKVKDALLAARAKGVSFAALAGFLAEQGLSVSEPTLRRYLHAQTGKKRRGCRKPSARKQAAPAAPATVPAEPAPRPSWKKPPQPEQPGKKLPPRLLRRDYLL